MCSTGECIAETMCVQNDSEWAAHSSVENLSSSNMEEITKKVDDKSYQKKNSSFKQVCEFPITVCRRGSKDVLSWLNSLTSSDKKSPSEVIRGFYNQIRSSLFLILMCTALITISVEACICSFLLISVLLEPGFLFLFSMLVGVGFIVLRILTTKQRSKPKNKIKSKEI